MKNGETSYKLKNRIRFLDSSIFKIRGFSISGFFDLSFFDCSIIHNFSTTNFQFFKCRSFSCSNFQFFDCSAPPFFDFLIFQLFSSLTFQFFDFSIYPTYQFLRFFWFSKVEKWTQWQIEQSKNAEIEKSGTEKVKNREICLK